MDMKKRLTLVVLMEIQIIISKKMTKTNMSNHKKYFENMKQLEFLIWSSCKSVQSKWYN